MTPNRRTDYFVYPVSGQPFIGWTDIVKPEIAVKVPNDVAGVIGHITELFFTLVQLVECPLPIEQRGPQVVRDMNRPSQSHHLLGHFFADWPMFRSEIDFTGGIDDHDFIGHFIQQTDVEQGRRQYAVDRPESVKNFVLLSCNLSLLTEDGI